MARVEDELTQQAVEDSLLGEQQDSQQEAEPTYGFTIPGSDLVADYILEKQGDVIIHGDEVAQQLQAESAQRLADLRAEIYG